MSGIGKIVMPGWRAAAVLATPTVTGAGSPCRWDRHPGRPQRAGHGSTLYVMPLLSPEVTPVVVDTGAVGIPIKVGNGPVR